MILTGDAPQFRNQFRTIPFAWRLYLKAEVKRLLKVGAIFPADPGACPYALRTVIAPKSNGSKSMYVDKCNINAQMEKCTFHILYIERI